MNKLPNQTRVQILTMLCEGSSMRSISRVCDVSLNTVDKLLQDKVSLGADASLAAGPIGRAANAATDAQLNAEMLSYSRTQGLFAGIDLSGGVLQPDTQADARAYGPNVTPRDIVDGTARVAVPVPAQSFVRALSRDVTATSGRR
jgi:lipid-binding SYLF domain-containing protein